MKKTLGLSFAAILLATFGVFGLFTSSANAENTSSAPYIGISPYKTNLELEPGKVYSGKFRVSNVGESAFEYEVSISPYQVTDENYTADFITMNNYTRIVDWVSFDEGNLTGRLEPHTASDYISYTITVPSDIPSGSQFAVIKATALNDQNASEGFSIQNKTSAGMILYATMKGGNTRATAKIIENKIPTFLSSGPLNATSLIENTGNIYGEAKYSLTVSSIFGGDPIYSNEDDEDGTTSTILPETKRFRTQTWQNVPFLGIFKVKQTVKIFDEYSEVEKIVFVCPFWLIIVAIIAIVALVFWLKSRSKARKAEI